MKKLLKIVNYVTSSIIQIHQSLINVMKKHHRCNMTYISRETLFLTFLSKFLQHSIQLEVHVTETMIFFIIDKFIRTKFLFIER